MLTRLTNCLSYQLYNFTRKPSTNPSFLNLYQSSVFKTENFDDIFNDGEAALRYKQILPTLLASQTPFYPKKFLYTSLGFDPNNQVIRVVTLRPSGYFVQQFSINKLIPFPYRDCYASSILPEVKLPIFIDDEMIYLNKFTRETIICEDDGIWNQEVVNHPKLSLQQRFKEKQWLDREVIY